uniref:Uncharacterized protein n=1 Tax=Candidatus Kentrum eta TaxID=2126337 RepID=A0A450V7I6_9GAMM|nr:MAG: hypothetical protein BECKH772B_GA0070898_102024 [Candidatus Kentron sp. H]VFK00783.1 MAG: hypothetical protein BECKH772A_GA0070896_102024 [Candidatus Kentron sp. H]VFK04696.1 MAG: hypothetical protein BECKH772C_GA0070978_102004 [Candidatus Kentron sp. H]
MQARIDEMLACIVSMRASIRLALVIIRSMRAYILSMLVYIPAALIRIGRAPAPIPWARRGMMGTQ